MRYGPFALLALSFTIAACGAVTPASPDGAGPPGRGHVAFGDGTAVFRIAASPGATPEDVSALVGAGGGAPERRLNLSPGGTTYVFETGDLGCATGTCVAVAPVADPAAAALIAPGGAPVDGAEGRSAVDDAGTLVVFAASGGPHDRDLFVTRRAGSGWGAPLLITAASPHAWNDTPSLSADASHLVFDCGPTANAGAGGSICEVGVDGSELAVVVGPADAPAAIASAGPVHHAAYAGDELVFEADWDGERVWRLGAGGPRPVGAVDNDNSPCALADGRVASLYLGRPGNTDGWHELKLMAADGRELAMLVVGRDLVDEGLGCGG
ncbi:MAG: hypothetical protein JNK64_33520 [Myxococcales bacterium]|nr:hypothetical protein [Myxococcales bacterium]